MKLRILCLWNLRFYLANLINKIIYLYFVLLFKNLQYKFMCKIIHTSNSNVIDLEP